MERLGRLGSPDGMRLLIEDCGGGASGSISPVSSPTFEDPVRSTSGKETLKRRYQATVEIEADDEDQTDSVEKKRRLTVDQVNFLEKSFCLDMKLEPERKVLLAKCLGVYPRQVAIWFQNRRARWKNKQLEHEFEIVRAHLSAVMKENENLLTENRALVEENKRLTAEVARLIISQQSSCRSSNLEFFGTLDGSQTGGTSGHIFQARDPGYTIQKQQHQLEEGYLSSSRSDLTVPTMSIGDHSEVQDSGQSYSASVGMVGATEAGIDGLNVGMMCPILKLDDREDLFGNTSNQYLIQQLAMGGLCSEDAHTFYLGGENGWFGFS